MRPVTDAARPQSKHKGRLCEALSCARARNRRTCSGPWRMSPGWFNQGQAWRRTKQWQHSDVARLLETRGGATTDSEDE